MKISVIMPVYNSEKYLVHSIESVLAQKIDEFELILVDDGSTDSCGEICDTYAKRDSRVRVIHQENKGICGARNAGLEAAQGEYLAFADNDDEVLPGWLEDNYEIAEKYQADMVKFGRVAEKIAPDGTILGRDVRELKEQVYDKTALQKAYFTLRDKEVFSPIWDGLYRRAIVEQYEIRFHKELRYGEEDTVFCLEFLSHVNCFVSAPGVYFHHYIRLKHSASSKFNQESMDKYAYSGTQEMKYLEKLQPVTLKGQYELSRVQHQLLPILIQLFHADCDWSSKKKKAYLRHLKGLPVFQYALNSEKTKYMWKKDKKKTLVAWLFEKKHYNLLLLCAQIYEKRIEKNEKNL